MKKPAFKNNFKKDILNILIPFVVLLLIIFSLLSLLKITSNVVLNVFLWLLLISALIAVCLLVGFLTHIISDYKHQLKYYTAIKNNLGNNYTPVFPKKDNLFPLSFFNKDNVIYKCRLDSRGQIVLKTEHIDDPNNCYTYSTSNFALFCENFSFEK